MRHDDDFSLVDEFSLAAALRAAGLAQGETALVLAAELVLLLGTPTPEMVTEAAIERATRQSEIDSYFANLDSEP